MSNISSLPSAADRKRKRKQGRLPATTPPTRLPAHGPPFLHNYRKRNVNKPRTQKKKNKGLSEHQTWSRPLPIRLATKENVWLLVKTKFPIARARKSGQKSNSAAAFCTTRESDNNGTGRFEGEEGGACRRRKRGRRCVRAREVSSRGSLRP